MLMAPIDRKIPLRPRPDLKTQAEFAMKDGNGNGVLTSDEYGVGKAKQNQFRRYDANHDGKLTLDEFARGRQKDALYDSIRTPFYMSKLNPELLEQPEVKGGGETK